MAESPSVDPASQADVQAALTQELEANEFRVRRLPGRKTGGHLLAVPRVRKRNQPIQALIGHCDTVWPRGTLSSMPITIRAGHMTGPGIYDMKGGLVLMMFALRALANQGLDMDIYLKTREMDEEGLREETLPVAETRVKRSLVLLEIAKDEEIEVSEEELQEQTERTLQSITQYMSEEDRKQFDSPTAMMNLAGNIYAELRMNRTLEYLRSVAKGDSELEAEGEEEPVEEATENGEETEAENLSSESESEEIAEGENTEVTDNVEIEEDIEDGEDASIDSDGGEAETVEESEG